MTQHATEAIQRNAEATAALRWTITGWAMCTNCGVTSAISAIDTAPQPELKLGDPFGPPSDCVNCMNALLQPIVVGICYFRFKAVEDDLDDAPWVASAPFELERDDDANDLADWFDR